MTRLERADELIAKTVLDAKQNWPSALTNLGYAPHSRLASRPF
jgi:hypothetical protein